MCEAWQQITEGLSQIGGEDAALRGAVLLGTGLAAVASLGLSLLRRKKPDRTRISVDAPPGERLSIRIGDDPNEETR